MLRQFLACLACLLVLWAPLYPQTAAYPSAVVGNSQLKVAKNNRKTTLRQAMSVSDTVITVADASWIEANMLLTIDSEVVSVSSVAGNNLTVTRAFDGTTAAVHSIGRTVSAYWTAWHHNAMREEVKAIQSALGANLSNVVANQVSAATYKFAAQSPGGSLVVGANAVTLTPCPQGVNGTDSNHYLYVSGGVGTAEAVLISGGTCTSGAASGTVIFTAANTHSGAWTIQSATAGVQEALQANSNTGVTVVIPSGTNTFYAGATVTGSNVTLAGVGFATRIDPRFDTATGVFTFSGSGVQTRNTIRDMWIYSEHSSHANRIAVDINQQNTFTSDRVFVSYTKYGYQVAGASTFLVRIMNGNINYLTASTGVGIYQTGGGDLKISNNVISGDLGPRAGIAIAATGSTWIDSNDVFIAGNGLIIEPGAGQSVEWLFSSNNAFDTNTGRGIFIDPNSTGVVKGVTFMNDWTSSNSESGFEIGGGAATVIDGIFLIGHRSYGNTKHGFLISQYPINLHFANCQAAGNSAGSAGTYHGLAVGSAASKFTVHGGLYGQAANFTNTQGYGILINAGASNSYEVVGTVVRGNVTAGFEDGGTGTSKVISNIPGHSDLAPPTVASGATISLGAAANGSRSRDVYFISGNTAISTVNDCWIDRTVDFIFTHATPAGFTTGGNIPRAQSAAQYQRVTLRCDGTNWY